ncbi:MAG TPA: RagB/SusD family nutrient uptake outer membrane protein, partial [Myxococcaceae bacterium]|nr:RagB/SusD family nutrient uptake outer membrane protein [Myxococcaceae bacterium]
MKRLLTGSLIVLFVGCGEMDIPDLNSPSEESLATSPTRTTLAAAATGLLIGARANYADPNGYIAMLGILGRELYNMDPADTRFITEMLESSQLNPGSPAFGGNFWNFPYANIRNAHNVLRAVDRVGDLSDAEREATRGFARTIQALDFLVIITTRDSQGAPIDVDRSIDEPLAPIVSKAEVLAHIATLLDEGGAHLAGGGNAFPFPLSSGFEEFATPPTFRQFNRALKARVEIYRENFQSAADAVAQSFLDVAKPLSHGVYHAFGTGSGDVVNRLRFP